MDKFDKIEYNIIKVYVIIAFCILTVYSLTASLFCIIGYKFTEENFYVFGSVIIFLLVWGFYSLTEIFERDSNPDVYEIKSTYMMIYPYEKIK